MAVAGLDKLLNNLKTIEKKVAKKLVKTAVDSGGGVVLKSFKANIPTSSPNLENFKRAAGKQTKLAKDGFAVCRVGMRKKYARDRKTKQLKLTATGRRLAKRLAKTGGTYPSRIFHLFEKGTAERVQETTGRHVGRIIAHPMLAPAVSSTQGAVITAMADKLRDGLASI